MYKRQVVETAPVKAEEHKEEKKVETAQAEAVSYTHLLISLKKNRTGLNN